MSVIPAGSGGSGAFTRSWWTDLNNSGRKTVPQLGDFNGDGVPDLAMNPRLGTVRAYPANGDGTFGSAVSLGTTCGGWGCDLGLLNAGTTLDFVIGDHTLGARAWTGNGAFGFTNVSPTVTGTFSGCGLADLNGDGNLDAVFGADQFSEGFVVLLGNGSGGWSAPTVTGLPPYAATGGIPYSSLYMNLGHFAFVDFDGDGDRDMFAFGQAGSGVMACWVYRNDGGGVAWTLVAALGGAVWGIGTPIQGSVALINSDPYYDIAIGGTIYAGGSGGSWSLATVVDDALVAHLADMTGDGKLDLVTHEFSQGLRLYVGDGTTTGWALDAAAGLPDTTAFPPGTGALTFSGVFGIDVADVNGNGALDIVRVFTAQTTGTSTQHAFVEAWIR
jgi:hypothetical protein